MATILLAGGAGYIGSHTAVELLGAGYDVVVADNFANSSPEAIRRVEKITGKTVKLYEMDIKDTEKLAEVFSGRGQKKTARQRPAKQEKPGDGQ